MSYAFDTLTRALNEHVSPALQSAGRGDLRACAACAGKGWVLAPE